MGKAIEFRIDVQIAGRAGQQQLFETQKRSAIRQCRALVKQGGFGSAGAVTALEVETGDDSESGRPPKNKGLVYQCHMGKTRKGKDVLKVDEL